MFAKFSGLIFRSLVSVRAFMCRKSLALLGWLILVHVLGGLWVVFCGFKNFREFWGYRCRVLFVAVSWCGLDLSFVDVS